MKTADEETSKASYPIGRTNRQSQNYKEQNQIMSMGEKRTYIGQNTATTLTKQKIMTPKRNKLFSFVLTFVLNIETQKSTNVFLPCFIKLSQSFVVVVVHCVV